MGVTTISTRLVPALALNTALKLNRVESPCTATKMHQNAWRIKEKRREENKEEEELFDSKGMQALHPVLDILPQYVRAGRNTNHTRVMHTTKKSAMTRYAPDMEVTGVPSTSVAYAGSLACPKMTYCAVVLP